MAMSTTRTIDSAKSKLAHLLETAGLSAEDAEEAADKAIDNMGKAIIEAIIVEIRSHAETSDGETIS